MRRIFILFFCIYCTQSFGQSKNDLEQTYLNIWEMKPKGNVKSVTYLQKTSNNVAKERRHKFTITAYYDTTGKITRYTYDSDIGGKKSQNFLKEFYYNIDSKISFIITKYILQKVVEKNTWNYDTLNKGYEKTTVSANYSYREKVSFSNDSNIITQIFIQDKSQEIKTEIKVDGNTKVTCTYYGDGKLSYKSIEEKKDSILKKSSLSYNKQGEIWQEIKSTSSPTCDKSESIITYTGGIKKKWNYTTTRNSYGDEIEMLQEKLYENTVEYTTSKYQYKYDTKGNYIYKACFVNELLMWEIKREIEYY
jgi:hypothetical protein